MPARKRNGDGPIFLGLDVSKLSIAIGILRPDEVVPDAEMIGHDEASIRRLISRFPIRVSFVPAVRPARRAMSSIASSSRWTCPPR